MPCRLSIAATGFHHLTWLRGTFTWPWRTWRRQLLEPNLQVYEFTHMPFGLSNAGSIFCHLMEQCLGDQQFVTFLLYLDNICIFAPSIEVMLDHIELVFSRLKEFHLKIEPKKCHFWHQLSVLGHVLSARRISANSKKVEKVWNWPTPTNVKAVHSFLGVASYYWDSFQNLPGWPFVYIN